MLFLFLFLCSPPMFNSAVASAFHDSVSSRLGTGIEGDDFFSQQDLNFGMR